jgi:hypothetical protein
MIRGNYPDLGYWYVVNLGNRIAFGWSEAGPYFSHARIDSLPIPIPGNSEYDANWHRGCYYGDNGQYEQAHN